MHYISRFDFMNLFLMFPSVFSLCKHAFSTFTFIFFDFSNLSSKLSCSLFFLLLYYLLWTVTSAATGILVCVCLIAYATVCKQFCANDWNVRGVNRWWRMESNHSRQRQAAQLLFLLLLMPVLLLLLLLIFQLSVLI